MRKTKFHMLVYTIPEMVVRWWSLGLTTEQVIEVLHAVWNRRKHLHCRIKNQVQQLVAQVCVIVW